MIETEKKQERVLIVGVELQDMENFDMSMEELASLAKTAGAEVVGVYTQKREKYDSKTFVGSGKLEEIAQMVEPFDPTSKCEFRRNFGCKGYRPDATHLGYICHAGSEP